MSVKSSKFTPDKRRKYDDALQAKALRLASESRSTQAAAQQLGISPKLLYHWQQAQLVAEVDSVEVALDPEVHQLRTQLKRAEQELDILKKSLSHLWPTAPVSTYRYIAQRRSQVPIRQLCQVLHVSASEYYAWQRGQVPAPEPAWQVAVRKEFRWYCARYGTRRLRAELHAQGHRVGRWRIRRALTAAGLRPNSRARLYPVPPAPTQLYARLPTVCWASPHPRRPTRYG